MKKAALVVLAIIFFTSLYAAPKFKRASKIKVKVMNISHEKGGPPREDKKFKKSEKVHIKLLVSGLKKNAKKEFHLQADFLMMGKNLKTALNKGRIIDQILQAGNAQTVVLDFVVTAGEKTQLGRNNIEIKVKDMITRRYNKIVIAIDFIK